MDEYVKQLRRQNEGGTCEHCGSALGHFNVCPLINRRVSEVIAAEESVPEGFTTMDKVFYRPTQEKPKDVIELERILSLEDTRG